MTWNLALRIWWSFAWRIFVYANIGGLVIGAIASAHSGGVLFDSRITESVATLVVLVGTSILAVKQALDAHQFRPES